MAVAPSQAHLHRIELCNVRIVQQIITATRFIYRGLPLFPTITKRREKRTKQIQREKKGSPSVMARGEMNLVFFSFFFFGKSKLAGEAHVNLPPMPLVSLQFFPSSCMTIIETHVVVDVKHELKNKKKPPRIKH